MQHLNFLIKPASSLCNMRCRYCFYADEAAARSCQSMGVMSKEQATILIREAFSSIGSAGNISFSFQGGEPTVAGLDYFRHFVEQVDAMRPAGVHVQYALQTNGLLIDEEWADFMARNHVLVGLSMDGTKFLHDSSRIDAAGDGTWDRVEAALRTLQRHHVEVNLLCVVSRSVARKPRQVYESLRDLGVRYLQFIACLDPIEEERGRQPWALTPQNYGKFLCGLFDSYYRSWKEGDYTSVRLFDDYIHLMMGMPAGTCATSGSCGAYLVVEGDGSVYPCDFYALDAWRMGRIGEQSIQELAEGERAQTFLKEGERKPDACSNCRWYRLCYGGCKRDWIEKDGRLENYLCPAFQMFFQYVESRLVEMAQVEMQYLKQNRSE